MDKTDKKILCALMINSRIPVLKLSKKLRISREVCNYRLERLKKEGIIKRFVTEINISALGYVSAAVFINIKATRQKEFKKFLEQATFVSWVAELSGIWSFGLSIMGRTNEELDEKFRQIYFKFKDDIIDHRFVLHRQSKFFYEKYFGSVLEIKARRENNDDNHKPDKKDKIILKELAVNSRQDILELSKKVNLTSPAVSQRIKNLERFRYIERYSLFVDTTKLRIFQYSVFVINKNPDQQNKLVSFLSQHTNISFIAEYIGDQFLEFGIFVNNPYEVRVILQEIEEMFPDNRVIEVSLFQHDVVSVGPPRCVFE